MNGEVKKQQPLMFTVSDYKELNSISSLIMIGKNIERVNFNELVKQFDPEVDTDLDVMHELVLQFYNTVLSTNNVEAISKKYMMKTTEFIDHYRNKMIDIVANPEEFDNYIQRPLEDPERFKKILDICMNMYNAVRVLVYNETDVHTVSLMTLMHMIGMMNVRDENLNYTLLKVIGRFNESKASDVDDWLQTIEYDYELFHQKNIMDSVTDLISLSPTMVLDLSVYRLLVSPEFDNIRNNKAVVEDEEAMEGLLSHSVDCLMGSAVRHLETITNIMNSTKYGISDFYMNLFDEELGMLPYYNVKSEVVDVETELGCEENTEKVKFKTKQYVPFVDEVGLRGHLQMVLCDYLSLGQ